MRKKNVYLVSRGYYSDYRVVAVFSTLQRAKEFMNLLPHEKEWNEVETYELDPPTVALIKEGYQYYTVRMRRDGKVESVAVQPLNVYSIEECSRDSIHDFYFVPCRGGGELLEAAVWAKSEQHAIKIVNEKRVQLIAQNKWKEEA
jgi:hypothetical protein